MERLYKENNNLQFYSDSNIKPKDEEWKTIEEFNSYEISNYGRVRNKDTNLLRKPYISNRGYLRITLTTDNKISLHREVISAFVKSIKKGNRLEEVNHIDGDKFNNHLSNLELVTPKENVEHAFNLGLRKTKSELVIKDLKEDRIIEIRSITLAKKILNIPRDVILTWYKRSKYTPLYGRYIIEKLNYETNKICSVDIWVYDLVSKTWEHITCTDVFQYKTGISYTTIDPRKIFTNTKYIAGYFIVVNHNSDTPPNKTPDIKPELAKADRENYYRISFRKRDFGVYVYNYRTKEEKFFKTKEEAAEFLGVNAKKLGVLLQRGKGKGRTWLCSGYGIKPEDMKDVEWYNYSLRNIYNSILDRKFDFKVDEVQEAKAKAKYDVLS